MPAIKTKFEASEQKCNSHKLKRGREVLADEECDMGLCGEREWLLLVEEGNAGNRSSISNGKAIPTKGKFLRQ